ncbi:pectate lyase superfamily protein-domain-containing protein [Xylariales sp. PMI_506]|nr:pectate lyase superfamily protein-domain-containing protein [Xylariales sp. PMI_506]
MRFGSSLWTVLAATSLPQGMSKRVILDAQRPYNGPEVRQATCSGPVENNPTTWWRAAIEHNGTTPTAADTTYQYYRTVIQYGADNTGVNDSSDAFNTAINAWNRTGNTVTTMPAYVYIPPGTYRFKASVQLIVSTYLIGDPIDRPTLIADPALGPSPLIYGYDAYQGDNSATKNFYMALRNVNIDTSEVDAATEAVAIDWSVSQGCSMNNVNITMPNSSKHIGITMGHSGSGVTIADCNFYGGAVGIQLWNQQYNFKALNFDGCGVGINIIMVYVATFQDITFSNCNFGIYTSNLTGAISLVDSSVDNCNAGVNAYVSGGAQGSLVIENFQTDTSTVAVTSRDRRVLLQGSVPAGQTWVMGNADPQGYQSGVLYPVARPSALLSGDKYFTMDAPQYEKYDIDQFVSLRGDAEYPVYGDNLHNDGPSINAILQKNAGCKIIFVPQGIYITEETIYVPPGTRMVGETLSIFSGNGSAFLRAEDPQPVVKVGNAGEEGVAQISDLLIEVADVLPGAVLMQINMAGKNAGDVAVWNTVLRVGGSRNSRVTYDCTSTDTATCKAAFALLHVGSSASLYAENVWGWVADHSLDDDVAQNIAVGRGALIESVKPTWLVGSSFEHSTLYQYSLNGASNVYIGMQQTESPYWQGGDQPEYAPAPWTPNSTYGDPTFANCASQVGANGNVTSADGQCHRAWAHYATNSSGVVAHGAALWVFFDAMNDNQWGDPGCAASGGVCQLNAVYLGASSSTFMYSLSSKSTANLVYDNDGGGGAVSVATQSDNAGGWGAVVAAYLRDSNEDASNTPSDESNSLANPSVKPHWMLITISVLATLLMS